MTDFYNTLFSIEVTILGIIIGIILVFFQLVYSQYSHREIDDLLKGYKKSLHLYGTLNFILIIITVLGSILLSFPHNNFFIPCSNYSINNIFQNILTPITLLIFYTILVALFIYRVVTRNLKYVKPDQIALLIRQGIDRDRTKIENYLLREYGIPSPDDIVIRYSLYESFRTKFPIEIINNEVDKRIEKNKKRYEEIRKKVVGAEDPLEPLDALIIRSINNTDFFTLGKALLELCEISKTFIQSHKEKRMRDDNWNPNYGIVEKYLRYLIEYFMRYCKISDSKQLDIPKIKILETSKKVIDVVLERDIESEIKIILKFWYKESKNAIGKSSEVFTKVIRLYQEVGNIGLENNVNQKTLWINEMFGYLGDFGKQLLCTKGIKKRSVLEGEIYLNESDQILSVLLAFGQEYTKYPNSYPHSYFNTVYVILDELRLLSKNSENREIRNYISNFLNIYFSFGQKAILNGNREGVVLVVMHLQKECKSLINTETELNTIEAIELLIKLGAEAAVHKKRLMVKNGISSLISDPIDEYIIKILSPNSLTNIALDRLAQNNDVNLNAYIDRLCSSLKANGNLSAFRREK